MTASANDGERAGSWPPLGIVQSWTVAPDSHPDHSATDVSAGSAPSAGARRHRASRLSVDEVRHIRRTSTRFGRRLRARIGPREVGERATTLVEDDVVGRAVDLDDGHRLARRAVGRVREGGAGQAHDRRNAGRIVRRPSDTT